MGYMKDLATMYADAWLTIQGLEWTEENWESAMNWVMSRSFEECRNYIKENY